MHSYKVIINADCPKVFNTDELHLLSSKFESFNFNENNSFCSIISYEPTYKAITNRFRIPDEYNFNKNYSEDAIALTEFMSIEEIHSISYFDYAGEHIHSTINQEKSWAAGDFEVSSARDLHKVSQKFLQYVSKENPPNERVKTELQNIIIMAELAAKYDLDIWFFDGYHWQV